MLAHSCYVLGIRIIAARKCALDAARRSAAQSQARDLQSSLTRKATALEPRSARSGRPVVGYCRRQQSSPSSPAVVWECPIRDRLLRAQNLTDQIAARALSSVRTKSIHKGPSGRFDVPGQVRSSHPLVWCRLRGRVSVVTATQQGCIQCCCKKSTKARTFGRSRRLRRVRMLNGVGGR
jgi:hypothetical protein